MGLGGELPVMQSRSRLPLKISMTYDERSINSYGVNIEPKTFKGNRIYSVLEELKEAVEELIEI